MERNKSVALKQTIPRHRKSSREGYIPVARLRRPHTVTRDSTHRKLPFSQSHFQKPALTKSRSDRVIVLKWRLVAFRFGFLGFAFPFVIDCGIIIERALGLPSSRAL
jgi:hypothetical protein